jgi:DNA-binding response OmpR family regulator
MMTNPVDTIVTTPIFRAPWYTFGDYALNPNTYTLYHQGQEKPLSTCLFVLLCAFVQHPQQVLSRETLLTLTSHSNTALETRRIDVAVKRLRAVLNDNNPENRHTIKTVRGGGYLFLPAVDCHTTTSVNPLSIYKTGASYD